MEREPGAVPLVSVQVEELERRLVAKLLVPDVVAGDGAMADLGITVVSHVRRHTDGQL